MNLIGVILFNLLLFNGCLSANVNKESTHSDTQRNKSENSANTLNEDFQYAIFDDSDLKQMLHFAKDPRCSDFTIKQIFPVKYQNYDFNIFTDNDDPQGNADQQSRSIFMSGETFYMDIIKYFGAFIHKLRIHDTNNDERFVATYKQVNEYCSESLNHLNLGTLKEIAFEQLQKPFSNVIDLIFHLKTNQNGSIASLDEMFPKLQRLTIVYQMPPGANQINANQFNGNRFIESEIPHMQHLREVAMVVHLKNHSDNAVVQQQLQKTFKNNPQIHKLIYYDELMGDFIKVISEHLPNLEQLMIWDFGSEIEIETVQFDNVKHLTLQSITTNPMEKLSFPRLETLKMFYTVNCENGSARDSWINFFENHQNIKQLNVSIYSHKGFVEFMTELPNVEELNIESFENFQIDLVGELFENHKNLAKFEYKSYSATQPADADEAEIANYTEKFGDHWNVSHSTILRPATLTFVKKN